MVVGSANIMRLNSETGIHLTYINIKKPPQNLPFPKLSKTLNHSNHSNLESVQAELNNI